MKPKRVYLVTASKAKTEEEFQKRPIYKSLKKLYNMYDRWEFEFEVVKDNKEGLSTVYNRYLTEEHKNDIVLFVHDDVIINDLFLVEHLRKSPYVVTGLAGTKKYNKSVEKTAWHLMSTSREDFLGEVAHTKEGAIWTTVFGPTQGRCKLIDGVFIAVNVEEVLKTNARFNEAFNWHHYDIAFCLECETHNVSVGVLPISIIHYGLGDSMLTQDWEESNKRFKGYYCKQIETI
jgi:hypothetical protein